MEFAFQPSLLFFFFFFSSLYQIWEFFLCRAPATGDCIKARGVSVGINADAPISVAASVREKTDDQVQ